MRSGATFCACRAFRYDLWRIWNPRQPLVTFIGLNPSTADETVNDPTIRRCIGFARHWDFGGLAVVNLFAFRCPKPQTLKTVSQSVGEHNDKFILQWVAASSLTVACWGNHGRLQDRDLAVQQQVRNLYCFRLNRQGQPAHPLYLPGNLRPVPYYPAGSSSS